MEYTGNPDDLAFTPLRAYTACDGTADDSDGLEEALSDAPTKQMWGPTGWERSEAVALVLPRDGVLRLTRTVEIPDGKNVTLFAPTPYSARVEAEGYAFDVVEGSVGRSVSFHNLTMDGGAIKVRGSNRGFLDVTGCFFAGTTVPAVHFVDAASVGVVGARVERNRFTRCAGGVWHEADTWAIVKVRDNAFDAMHDVDIRVDGQGLTLDGNDHQSRLDTALDKPYIHIGAGDHDASGVTIRDCRFGPEAYTRDGNSYQAPEAAIVAGPLAGPGASVENVGDVSISDCRFFAAGASNGPTSGAHAIILNDRPDSWRVRDNHFRAYDGAFVDEAWTSVTTTPAQVSFWTDNTESAGHIAGTFSGDNLGWTVT